MLDRALAKVFAELSTLLLIACVFTVPLFVGHAIVFRGPLALRELAPDIVELPEGRQVRGVASSDIEAERRWLLVISGVALLSIPFVYRAAGRVFEVQETGAVPSVPDALGHLSGSHAPVLEGRTLGVGIVLAAVSGWLVWQISHLVAAYAQGAAWLAIGIGRAFAVGTGVALVSGVLAARSSSAGRTTDREPEQIDLY